MEINKRLHFHTLIAKKLGDSTNLPPDDIKPSLSDADNCDYDPRENDSDKPLGWIDGDPVDSNDTAASKIP